jgi:hypothetical protein
MDTKTEIETKIRLGEQAHEAMKACMKEIGKICEEARKEKINIIEILDCHVDEKWAIDRIPVGGGNIELKSNGISSFEFSLKCSLVSVGRTHE